MRMTDGDILVSYRQAKGRTEQIGVLADLNACGRREIIHVLRRCGETAPTKGKGGPLRKADRDAWTEDLPEHCETPPPLSSTDCPDFATESAEEADAPKTGVDDPDPAAIGVLGGMELCALYKIVSEVKNAFPTTRVVFRAKRRIGGATLLVHYGVGGTVDEATLVLNEQQ